MDQQTGPEAQPSSATQVEQEIQQAIQAQPTLSNSKLGVRATNTSVVMSGTVADERQHQMALRVAALHASGLRIVDHIKVQQ
jgi:osmotically-inducible protein OsmY